MNWPSNEPQSNILMKYSTIGVIGAGVMGAGVAQNLAQRGMRVILVDVDPEVLRKAEATIRNAIRFSGMFNQDASGDDPDTIIGRIRFVTDRAPLAEAEYVIENVVEKWDVKEAVYREIDTICAPECIFAANTSAISITRIAGATSRPDRVVGIHFMNPVPMKPTVELIRGFHSSEDAIGATRALLGQMGKKAIVVNDMPGFVSNRVLMLTVNEAIFVVQDQVAPAADVDKVFVECFGHKMGPLATGDLIGLDTILYSLDVLYESYNDSKFRPAPLLKKMVDAGLHGRKTGQGFFKYPTFNS